MSSRKQQYEHRTEKAMMNDIPTNPEIHCSDNCSKLIQLDSHYHSLISKFSHEIRNPLTLIYSSLQLIEKDCPAVLSSDLWSQVKQDIQDTLSLLKDLSTLNGNAHIHKVSVPASDFLSGIAASFSSFMREREITFTAEFDTCPADTMIFADELKLKEAITNLLLNAADAVLENHAHRNIVFSAEIIQNRLHIHVKDNGPGIPAEYLDNLFAPFVTHKSNGTGLGLAVTESIVNLHEGQISVDTSTDEKTSFTDFCLQIPLVEAQTL